MDADNVFNKEKIEVEQIKIKNKFEKVKNDNFIEKLFNNMQKKRLLNILIYNKNMKKRININSDDYKEYSETYSSIEIEIEIKPVVNKYDKIINFKREDEKYYHIYFNNDKEEIKRNYINKREEIETIKIIIDYQIKSFEGLFR